MLEATVMYNAHGRAKLALQDSRQEEKSTHYLEGHFSNDIRRRLSQGN